MTLSPTRLLAATLLLVAVFALALASFHPWDLAIGALIALATLWTFRGFLFSEQALPATRLLRRLVAFWPFAAALTWEIVRGT